MNKKHILKVFAKYVSFNVLAMLGISCYILADTFFISKGMGSNGLASLNFAIPIFSIIFGIGLMVGIGGATKYAILQAQAKTQEANKIFSNAIVLGVVLGIFFALLGIFYSSKLSTWLGAGLNTLEMTNIYLKTVLFFAPFFIFNNILLCFIRNDGAPRLAMAAMLIGSISNIFLDYLLIFWLNLGMFGAAFATGLSPIISIGVFANYFIKKRNKFKFIKCRLLIKRTKEIFSLGLSAFITEISVGLVIIIFNNIIFSLQGNTGVAAYGIILNLALVATAVFTGVSQGIQPIISTNYGKGDFASVQTILRYSIFCVVGVALILYFVTFFFAEPIVSVFNRDNDIGLEKLALDGLRLYFTAFIFVGVNIVSASFFSAIELPFKAFIISVLRGGLIIIPLVFLLSKLLGITGVWISYPCAEFATFIFVYYYLSKSRRQLKFQEEI